MPLFFLAISLVLGLMHGYMFWRLGYYLDAVGTQRLALGLTLGLLYLLTLAIFPALRFLPQDQARFFVWISYSWLGLTLFLSALLVMADAAWIGSYLVNAPVFTNPDRRAFFERMMGLGTIAGTAALGIASTIKALTQLEVKEVAVTLDRWPASLNGLRIAQITDIHIGPTLHHDWMQQVVERVNALKPDLIAVTGDLVDGSVDALRHHIAPLANLTAPHGVYYVTGNHEYYSGVEAWRNHVAELGLRVLSNERVTLSIADKGAFDVAGVEDWGARHFKGVEGPNLAKALQNRDADLPLILLAHQPAAIHEAAEHGVDLQLSGHTHGGQMWPFGYLVYLQQPYVKGLHRHRDTRTHIYISEGTGYWGPPMRLGTTAEITLLTLRSTKV